MKKIFFVALNFVAFAVYGQKLEYNPNRDPIKTEDQIKTVPPKIKTMGLILRDASNLGNTAPLFIADGKIISKEEFSKLQPETIESVTVLKDKNSTELYGEKAKNGVLLIKTKILKEKDVQ